MLSLPHQTCCCVKDKTFCVLHIQQYSRYAYCTAVCVIQLCSTVGVIHKNSLLLNQHNGHDAPQNYVKEFKSDKLQISSTVLTSLHCALLLPHADGNTVIDVWFRSFVCIRHWLEVAAWCTATGSGSSSKQGHKTI